MTLIPELTETFLKRFPLTRDSTVICSYSGGPDSTFLLHLLAKAREKAGFKLIAFYLNHNLRGKESMEEEKFVLNTISQLSVPTVFFSRNIALIARERKVSTELCGRETRREIIRELIATFNPDYVCTGHHRDDRVETYLFNTFRGSGLHGLTTLKEKDGKMLRPLISLSKAEIEGCLKEERIPFLVDSTNSRNDYSRNKIRNIVIPAARDAINPSLEETVSRNIGVLEEYEETVGKLVEAFMSRYVRRIGNYVYLSGEMKNDPLFTPLLFKEAVRNVMRTMSSAERNLSFTDYERLRDYFQGSGEKTLALDLPGDTKAFLDEKGAVLVFHREMELLASLSETMLSVDDVVETPYFRISLKPFEGKPKRMFPLNFPLTVRGRRAGDRVFVAGLPDPKKAKELLIDRKVPVYEKVFHPVIELPDGSSFLAGIGMEGIAFELQGKRYDFYYVPARK